jgi:hypothetical protein
MSATLLEQFLSEECTAHVRRLLEEGIADTKLLRPHFAFNRFEVTLERADGFVLIEDVLDVTEAGAERVPLRDFIHALDRRSA